MKLTILLPAIALIAFGCRPVTAAQDIKAGGAKFSFPNANLEQEAIDNDNFTIKTNAYQFEFKAGLMVLDGKPRGTARSGDDVVVHPDGSIDVNGVKR